jgi:hypothetical protein
MSINQPKFKSFCSLKLTEAHSPCSCEDLIVWNAVVKEEQHIKKNERKYSDANFINSSGSNEMKGNSHEKEKEKENAKEQRRLCFQRYYAKFFFINYFYFLFIFCYFFFMLFLLIIIMIIFFLSLLLFLSTYIYFLISFIFYYSLSLVLLLLLYVYSTYKRIINKN